MLTAGLLSPIKAVAKLECQRRTQLDRLYQRVIDDLDKLLASKPRDCTLKREQNSCYEHDNGLSFRCIRGGEYSTIRQAKETVGQRRLDLDTAQAAVVQAWGQLDAGAQIIDSQAQVTAAEVALAVCAKKLASGSAPRSTFSMRSRRW
jgi:hypothetical protein